MNYHNQHLTAKQSSVIIPKSALQKGMVIQNRYTNLDNKSDNYMWLVLNPIWENKVHVLNLNLMSSIQFNAMARRTGVRIIPKYRKRALEIPKLIMNESSQRFYHSKLSSNMDSMYSNSYRTIFPNKMGLVQLIDYRFDLDIRTIQ
jgi:hypothetical protein